MGKSHDDLFAVTPSVIELNIPYGESCKFKFLELRVESSVEFRRSQRGQAERVNRHLLVARVLVDPKRKWRCCVKALHYDAAGVKMFPLTVTLTSNNLRGELAPDDTPHEKGPTMFSASMCYEKEDGKLGMKRFTDPDIAREKFNANCKLIFDVPKKSKGSQENPIAYVNRELLSLHCKMFRAMFEGDYREKDADEIPLKEVSHEDFLLFLCSLHSPYFPVNRDNVGALLSMADRFDCQIVMKQCEEFLNDNPPAKEDDIKMYIVLADRFQLQFALDLALEYSVSPILAELLNPDWNKSLNHSTLHAILSKAYHTFRTPPAEACDSPKPA